MSAALHPQVDLELKKAFEEMQVKMVQTKSQMKLITTQTDALKRQIQHSKLTEAEIGALADDVRMYEGIGRMFVLSDKSGILKTLGEKGKGCEAKIATLEKSKDYLEKSEKDCQNSLRELIAAKQAKK